MRHDPMQQAVGRQMRLLMEAAGLRVGQVAAELKVKPQTVHAWFAGKRRVSPETRKQMADLFGVSEKEFYNQQAEVKDAASRIVLEALDRIARGEEPGTAFAAATGGVEQLTTAEREAVLAGIGQLLAYLNEAARGDWKSLPPDRRLSMVEQLIEGENPG